MHKMTRDEDIRPRDGGRGRATKLKLGRGRGASGPTCHSALLTPNFNVASCSANKGCRRLTQSPPRIYSRRENSRQTKAPQTRTWFWERAFAFFLRNATNNSRTTSTLPPTSCEYLLTTEPQTTRNLLKFQGISPGLPEAALSHAKSGEDWRPFTSTFARQDTESNSEEKRRMSKLVCNNNPSACKPRVQQQLWYTQLACPFVRRRSESGHAVRRLLTGRSSS